MSIHEQIQQIICYINHQLKNTYINYVEFGTQDAILFTNKRNFVVGFNSKNFKEGEKVQVDMYVNKIPKVYIELIFALDTMFPQFDFAFQKEEK